MEYSHRGRIIGHRRFPVKDEIAPLSVKDWTFAAHFILARPPLKVILGLVQNHFQWLAFTVTIEIRPTDTVFSPA
jgi:hypothetical protein